MLVMVAKRTSMLDKQNSKGLPNNVCPFVWDFITSYSIHPLGPLIHSHHIHHTYPNTVDIHFTHNHNTDHYNHCTILTQTWAQTSAGICYTHSTIFAILFLLTVLTILTLNTMHMLLIILTLRILFNMHSLYHIGNSANFHAMNSSHSKHVRDQAIFITGRGRRKTWRGRAFFMKTCGGTKRFFTVIWRGQDFF